MGIPNLITALRPFATSALWSRPEDGSPYTGTEYLIIDGPSLAYYIYHQCLISKSRASDVLESIPSYKIIGEAVVHWLENIETFGLRVKHIYFDGFLPEEKKYIRYERLGKYAAHSRAFKSSHVDVPVMQRSAVTKHDKSKPEPTRLAFGKQHISSKATSLPAAPFLVPAVIEALAMSQYCDMTKVVPSEADDYCVGACEVAADIILTSDSDLLVKQRSRDAGGILPNSVMFFNDLDFVTKTPAAAVLRGLRYRPQEIHNLLKFEIRQIAYFILEDPNLTARECARRSCSVCLDEPESDSILNFMKKQEIKLHPKSWCFAEMTDTNTEEPGTSEPLCQVLRWLDPRISEFVLQFRGIVTSPSVKDSGSKTKIFQSPNMFLPFLMDDADRASAWRPSASFRCLAYSIMKDLDTEVLGITEVDRRGTRMIASDVETFEADIIFSQCLELRDYILRLLETYNGAGNLTAWTYLSLHTTLRTISQSTGTLPARSTVQKLLHPSTGKISWAALHLHAQVQATLYSLRMLDQTLQVHLASSPDRNELISTTEVFRALHSSLVQMPPLGILFRTISDGLLERESVVNSEKLYREFYHPYESPHEPLKGRNGKKKKPGQNNNINADIDSGLSKARENRYWWLDVG